MDLKGSDTNIFRRSGDRLFFSQNVNKGVFQVLEYIDTCSEMQSYMRDTLKLTDFREPKGLLLVGREKELTEDEKKQKLRASWNRNSKSLQIRTYDALIRQIQAKIKVISSS